VFWNASSCNCCEKIDKNNKYSSFSFKIVNELCHTYYKIYFFQNYFQYLQWNIILSTHNLPSIYKVGFFGWVHSSFTGEDFRCQTGTWVEPPMFLLERIQVPAYWDMSNKKCTVFFFQKKLHSTDRDQALDSLHKPFTLKNAFSNVKIFK
jgi:hypothetical protein